MSAIVAVVVATLGGLSAIWRWSRKKAEPTSKIKGSATNIAGVNGIVPHQLPPDIPNFVGRQSEMKTLSTLVRKPRKHRKSIVIISTVSGLGGVGKTSLVVHWAHQFHQKFPDGQLYIDLRGFHPVAPPMSPKEALETFLRTLGVPGDQVPPTEEARSAMFRTLIYEKRILIILDNARSYDQILSLLPGSSSCYCLVTSRDTLSGLVTRDGAHRITLSPFAQYESSKLVRSVLSEPNQPKGISMTDAHLKRLHKLCGGLPLAVRLVSEKVAQGTADAISALTQDAISPTVRLDTIDIPSSSRTSIRGVASWSYKALRPVAARVFRTIGANPGQDSTTAAIASMCGMELNECKLHLAELRAGSLIEERTPGRWWMHDLLKEYASECLQQDDPEQVNIARENLCKFYLSASAKAVDQIAPFRERIPSALPPTSAQVPDFANREDAMTWLEAERTNLIETIRLATRKHLNPLYWHLLHTLWRFYYLSDYITLGIDLTEPALAQARADGDRYAQVALLNYLGLGLQRIARYGDALELHTEAEKTASDIGYDSGRERALLDMGNINYRLGHYDLARTYYDRALQSTLLSGNKLNSTAALQNLGMLDAKLGNNADAVRRLDAAIPVLRELGHTYGVATALSDLAVVDTREGRFDNTLKSLHEALSLVRELGSKGGECEMLNQIGFTETAKQRFDDAVRSHKAALVIASATGDMFEKGVALDGIGRATNGAGRRAEALETWAKALELFTHLGVPEAEDVRQRMQESEG
jgi:tetratricopeptide (TPR) repeat protein